MRARALAAVRRAAAFVALAAAGTAGACHSVQPEARMAVAAADGHRISLDSATVDYTVDGVRVIQRSNYGTWIVAANLYLLGGARQLTTATQGIEPLLLRAGEYGSAAYPGAAARAAWGRTGSQLEINDTADWTLYGFRALSSEFDTSWNVWADRLLHPTLADTDVAVARGRMAAALRVRRATPDGRAFFLADSIAYAGHPYALRTEGTEASLAALDSAALRRYADSSLVTSRMLLVVVGNVERATVERAVRRTLARLPRGAYAWILPSLPAPATRAEAHRGVVALVPRALETNYVLGVFYGPPASDPAVPAFRVATALLGARMHQVVREQNGLSYAAYAPYLDRGATGGLMYMSTTAPDVALRLVRAQLDSLREVPYPGSAMRYFTDQFVTRYIAENATSAAQADFLARAQLYLGDYHSATRAMDALRGVSGNEVRAAAARYLTHPRFVFLGDTTRVRRAAFADF